MEPPIDSLDQKTFTITELNRRAKRLLEIHLPLVWVEGEVSNFSRPSSGHWYFTLKDASAQVRTAMFKGRNGRVKFTPKNGDRVKIRAKVSLYEGRGEYQLIAEHMEEAGLGLLQKQYEVLKQKLFEQGLFDASFKKPLPHIPKGIAVITSPTGAAVKDVLSVLKRRYPAIPITILPVPVQGEGASAKIIRAIELANEQKNIDVILVTRGGGSIEDLWAFNCEQLARTIYDSRLPVVSAIGHEIDFTIADFVADLRAPTPSAAAEVLCPNKDDYIHRIDTIKARLHNNIAQKINIKKERLSAKKLQHPLQLLNYTAQRVDTLELQLTRLIQQKLSNTQQKKTLLTQQLFHQSPVKQIKNSRERIAQYNDSIQLSMTKGLDVKQLKLAHFAHALDSASPLSIISRGYSITQNDKGEIVRSVNQVDQGNSINVSVHDGMLEANITRKVSK